MNATDRMMLNNWLSASATKFMHPDKQVRVVISRPVEQDVLEVLLSGPEAESAIRQLMQAYADALGKSLQLCAYPNHKVQAQSLLARSSHHCLVCKSWHPDGKCNGAY